MQPQFRQTPPGRSFSTRAVLSPSWAARPAPDDHQVELLCRDLGHASTSHVGSLVVGDRPGSRPIQKSTGWIRNLDSTWSGVLATVRATRCCRSRSRTWFAEADRVALRVTVHRGRATPDSVRPTIMEILRVERGRVAEIWG